MVGIWLLLVGVGMAQTVFILSSSVGYYNYRQNANALAVYQLLRERGFPHRKLLLAYPENVGCCEKNPQQGAVSFIDGQYESLARDTQPDLGYSALSAQTLLAMLGGKWAPSHPNIHRLPASDEPYFIYLTGHGGDYYFKVREREALVSAHFTHLLRDLWARGRRGSIQLLSDSCSAATPFEDIRESNFAGLGSSSLGEKSLSYGYDPLLHAPKSDEFTYHLVDFLSHPSSHDRTLRDLHSHMDVGKLKVHAKLLGSRRQQTLPLSHFLTPRPAISERALRLAMPHDENF